LNLSPLGSIKGRSPELARERYLELLMVKGKRIKEYILNLLPGCLRLGLVVGSTVQFITAGIEVRPCNGYKAVSKLLQVCINW